MQQVSGASPISSEKQTGGAGRAGLAFQYEHTTTHLMEFAAGLYYVLSVGVRDNRIELALDMP